MLLIAVISRWLRQKPLVLADFFSLLATLIEKWHYHLSRSKTNRKKGGEGAEKNSMRGKRVEGGGGGGAKFVSLYIRVKLGGGEVRKRRRGEDRAKPNLCGVTPWLAGQNRQDTLQHQSPKHRCAQSLCTVFCALLHCALDSSLCTFSTVQNCQIRLHSTKSFLFDTTCLTVFVS